MKRTMLVILSLATLTTTPARAETTERSSIDDLHLDLEVDPTAYVFSGYSIHAGIGWKQLRLDLGAYAMDVPAFLHGNDGWDAAFDGIGAKLQWFPFAEQRGAYIDVSGGVSWRTATLSATGASAHDTVGAIGIDAGYRFTLPYSLYVTPWAGISYDLADSRMMRDGKRFEMSRVTPFAAVHFGYRFR